MGIVNGPSKCVTSQKNSCSMDMKNDCFDFHKSLSIMVRRKEKVDLFLQNRVHNNTEILSKRNSNVGVARKYNLTSISLKVIEVAKILDFSNFSKIYSTEPQYNESLSELEDLQEIELFNSKEAAEFKFLVWKELNREYLESRVAQDN